MGENNKDKRIFKYELDGITNIITNLPDDAQILTAQFQDSNVCCWILASYDNEEVKKEKTINISIFHTGELIPYEISKGSSLTYITTLQRLGYVYHIFEIINCRDNIIKEREKFSNMLEEHQRDEEDKEARSHT